MLMRPSPVFSQLARAKPLGAGSTATRTPVEAWNLDDQATASEWFAVPTIGVTTEKLRGQANFWAYPAGATEAAAAAIRMRRRARSMGVSSVLSFGCSVGLERLFGREAVVGLDVQRRRPAQLAPFRQVVGAAAMNDAAVVPDQQVADLPLV